MKIKTAPKPMAKVIRIEQPENIILYNAEDARYVLRAYFRMAGPGEAFWEALDYLEISESRFFKIQNRGPAAISRVVDKMLETWPAEHRALTVTAILIDISLNFNFLDFFTEVTKAKNWGVT